MQVALGVADVFFQRGGEDLHGAGRMRQLGAQLFHRFQRGLETARQLGAELRVARQFQRPRETVGRGHRHAHRRGEFVDRHGGDAELVRQHVLGHLVLGTAQRGLGRAIRSAIVSTALFMGKRAEWRGKRGRKLCKFVYR